MVLAKLAAYLKKAIANFDCCPNGGFPITKQLFVLGGTKEKKSCCKIDLSSGNRSNAKQLGRFLEKLPFPAEGSIIKSYFCKSRLSINCLATVGLV